MTFPFWARGMRAVAPPEPLNPRIELSLEATTFVGNQSGTSQRIATLTRRDGYTGTVTLSASGLPSGTTMSVSPATFTGDTTQAVVTLTHSAGASLVTAQAWTLTATGAGVDSVSVNATVTVQSGAPASISIALSGTDFTVFQGSTSTRVVTLTRAGGYAGEVSFTAEGLPSGVSMTPFSMTGATSLANVTLVATSGADLIASDPWTLRASGSGVADATIACTANVQAQPDFAPNLPSGYEVVTDLTFDATYPYPVPDPTNRVTFNYKGMTFAVFADGRGKVAATAGTPNGTGFALEGRNQPSHINGYTLVEAEPLTLPSGRRGAFYVQTLWIPSDWQNHASGTKLIYPYSRLPLVVNGVTYTSGDPLINRNFFLQLNPNGNPLGVQRLRFDQISWWTGSAWSGVNFENTNGYSQANPFPIQRETWYRIELHTVMETGPQSVGADANGILELWVSTWNGSGWNAPLKLMHYTTCRFSNVSLINPDFVHISTNFKRSLHIYHGGDVSPAVANSRALLVDRWAQYISPT